MFHQHFYQDEYVPSCCVHLCCLATTSPDTLQHTCCQPCQPDPRTETERAIRDLLQNIEGLGLKDHTHVITKKLGDGASPVVTPRINVIQINGKDVWIVAIHLSHISDKSCKASAVISLMEEINKLGVKSFICGDFNFSHKRLPDDLPGDFKLSYPKNKYGDACHTGGPPDGELGGQIDFALDNTGSDVEVVSDPSFRFAIRSNDNDKLNLKDLANGIFNKTAKKFVNNTRAILLFGRSDHMWVTYLIDGVKIISCSGLCERPNGKDDPYMAYSLIDARLRDMFPDKDTKKLVKKAVKNIKVAIGQFTNGDFKELCRLSVLRQSENILRILTPYDVAAIVTTELNRYDFV